MESSGTRGGSTADGAVYVVDHNNFRIQAFAPEPPVDIPTGQTPLAVPTGEQAAALKRCKRKAKKQDWSKKRLRKCKRQARTLPV